MANSTVRFYGKIKMVRISTVPGDVLHRLLVSAQSADGKLIPAGAEFTLQSSGYDGVAGEAYQDVVLRAQVAS